MESLYFAADDNTSFFDSLMLKGADSLEDLFNLPPGQCLDGDGEAQLAAILGQSLSQYQQYQSQSPSQQQQTQTLSQSQLQQSLPLQTIQPRQQQVSASACTTPQPGLAVSALVACNNKRALDARWPDELLTMSTVDLNRYLRTHQLEADDIALLKEARRRMKSRGYSKTARLRKKEHSRDSPDCECECDGEQHESLRQEVVSLRREVDRLRHNEAKLVEALCVRGVAVPQLD